MKRGFTLAELLGVIVILGVIAIIVTPIVTGTLNESKEKAYNKQISIVENAAKKWGTENIDLLPDMDSEESQIISLDTLINSGQLQDASIKNPKTGEELEGCIVISYNSEYNQYEYKYSTGTACDVE